MTTISGGIRFDGISSGTDFSAMIDQLKKVESIQKNRMELWKNEWEVRLDAFEELRAEIDKLQTTIGKMDSIEEFLTKTATSSNSDIISATAGTEAIEGSYKLEVHQLATNAIRTYQPGFDSKTAVVNNSGGAQEFVYTYQGEQRTVSVASGTTLEGMVNLINKDPNNPGVRASLIKTGDQYVFQLKGMDLGAANSLTIDASTTVGALNMAPDQWHVQDPQNALYRINDWPAGSWLESSSNTLNEAIEGVTLNLKDTGTSQISVETNTEKVVENIESFVESMNAVRTKIIELTKVDEHKSTSDIITDTSDTQFESQMGSSLTGNYGVQLLASNLKIATSNMGRGFAYQYEENGQTKGDMYTSLAQLGIMTVADESSVDNGLLAIDHDKLKDALAKNPNEVAELFALESDCVCDSIDFSYGSHVEGITKPGTYDVKYDIDASGNIINATIGGRPATVDQDKNTILAPAGSGPAQGLLLKIDNLTPGSYSDTARIRQGKMVELGEVLKTMTDTETGTLTILENNYKDIMDEIDKKIEREETRLIKWERTQRLKFSRLEATLTMYDQQAQALSSAMQQMSKG